MEEFDSKINNHRKINLSEIRLKTNIFSNSKIKNSISTGSIFKKYK